MNQKQSAKLKARDFINIGIFMAILLLMEMIVGALGFIHPLMVVSYSVLVPLIGGIPMMLFYTRIEKFGMLTIFSIILAILLFVFGMGFLGAPIIILCGLAADLIAKKGGYKSRKLTVLSYGVFSPWVAANYIPIVVTGENYARSLQEGGFTEEYTQLLLKLVNIRSLLPLAILCFVSGILGALLGRRIMHKHFEKAGIA